jgi:hypothetical protein
MTRMATPQIGSTAIRFPSGGWPVDALVDEVIWNYVEWREELEASDAAYGRWIEAPAAEQTWRYAAYTGALDREEAAADAYAGSIADLLRWLGPSRPSLSLKQQNPQRRL